MPLYRVVCDGTDILDYSSKDLVLLAPDLELEINTAGSFEFVMPPYHRYYDVVQMFTSTIEVYEDEDCIWFGRPVEEKIDFYKQKKIYCEGPLSFFNDTVQRHGEFDQISLEQFFEDIITRHNQQIDDSNRKFTVGSYRMGTDYVYRKLDYESSYDVLTSMCLDTNGGYLFFERADGINYINWFKEMPYTCNQSIQFGLNLLNYSSSFDGSDFATCVLPLGESSRDEVTGEDTYVTIADINDGSDVLRSEAADTYGTIIKVERWSDYTSPHDLLMDAQKWLEDTQFNASSIECSAADLHSKDGNYELFRVGQMVHCVSNPHLVDKDFPLSKMSLRLDSAVKIITLGIIKRKTLTRIYKKDIEEASQYDPEQYYPEDYGEYDNYDPGVIEDENGDLWELKWPEDGGQVTAERMPTHITIARDPNKTQYRAGETLDFTGLLVNIWTKDKNGVDSIWTKPPKYLDGRAPMAELTFSTKKAPNISEFSVMVTWKYKGKSYNTTLTLQGIDTGPSTGPVRVIAKGTTARIHAANGHIKEYHFSAGSGFMTKILTSDRSVYHIYASANSGTIASGRSVQGGQDHDDHELTSRYTYNGKTVFYSAYSGSWRTKILEISPVCNNGNVTSGVTETYAKAVAWHLIYG